MCVCVAFTLHGGQNVCVNLLLINGFSAVEYLTVPV